MIETRHRLQHERGIFHRPGHGTGSVERIRGRHYALALTRPYDVLNPVTPQNDAGILTDPPSSLPTDA
jgi:hypothetical protein